MGDGDFFVRLSSGNAIQAGKGSYPTFYTLTEEEQSQPYSPWLRLILTFTNGEMRMYCNGVEAESQANYPTALGAVSRYSLPINEPLYLFSEPNGTNADGTPNFAASDDDKPFPCAAIAFWNRVLNAGQVQALGGIAH